MHGFCSQLSSQIGAVSDKRCTVVACKLSVLLVVICPSPLYSTPAVPSPPCIQHQQSHLPPVVNTSSPICPLYSTPAVPSPPCIQHQQSHLPPVFNTSSPISPLYSTPAVPSPPCIQHQQSHLHPVFNTSSPNCIVARVPTSSCQPPRPTAPPPPRERRCPDHVWRSPNTPEGPH
jgi:hypothetical protein